MKLIIENVRSFAGRHDIPVKPLTIVTGENSAGKTTLLAMLAVVCDPERFPLQPGFNNPPFNLGSYDTIATYKGGKFGRAKSFTVGYTGGLRRNDEDVRVEATYVDHIGQPELSRLCITRGDTELTADITEIGTQSYTGNFTLRSPDSKVARFPFELERSFGNARKLSLRDVLLTSFISADHTKFEERGAVLDRVLRLSHDATPHQAQSVAPIRSKPERTYGQIADAYQPAGDHIPFYLDQIFRDESTQKERQQVVSALEKFGKEAGLFKKFNVKKLGNKPSDPFQLMVTVAGRAANIIDVGYGVSQSLPLIVQSSLSMEQQLLLLQQPEVHLHPRAQAALGTFFAELAASGERFLVIETHSDYIIDRIRQEIAAGTIQGTDVEILFVEKRGIESTVHVLNLDEHGNITNAPASYREFFLEEELNLLDRTASI
jgi:energy-coupling factor transporter ATP-binding protein EcfA2